MRKLLHTLWHSAHDACRGVRCAPVTAIVVGIDLSVCGLFVYLWGLEYAAAASVVGAAVSYPLSFLGHRLVSFGRGMTSLRVQIGTFAVYKMPMFAARLTVFGLYVAQWKADWGLASVPFLVSVAYLVLRWIFTGESPAQFCCMVYNRLRPA